MVKFLDWNTEMDFRRFVNNELAYKYDQYIEVIDDEIVTGLSGNDQIQECLKVGFFVEDSKNEWVENLIATDIHKYCFEHKLNLVKSPVIERVAWNGRVKYYLVYTNGDE